MARSPTNITYNIPTITRMVSTLKDTDTDGKSDNFLDEISKGADQ